MSDQLKSFLQDMVVRAIKTFAQSLLALIVADGAVSIVAVNWPDKLAIAGLAAVVSVLTTIVSGLGTGGSPAIGEAVTPNPQVVAKVDPKEGVVAADASPLANGEPVAVTPVTDTPPVV